MARRTCLYLISLLLVFISNYSLVAKAQQINITTDSSSLLALLSHITPSSGKDFLTRNWTIGSSVCDWYGITCGTRHQRVVALNISSMGLEGYIPPHIGNLSFLNILHLGGNNFFGHIPSELANLHRLEAINLNINKFSGDIPAWIGTFHRLKNLSLANNSFTGVIPTSLSNISMLEVFDVRHNGLTGNLSGEMWRNLPRLRELFLSHNHFKGRILFGLHQCSNLEIISISYNSWTGEIPREIGNMSRLEYLYIQNSLLTGVIPDENMTGCVSDFGLTKLFGLEEFIAHTNTIATIGYIAPEYGSKGLVSTNSDVYSYGILLMEMFSRKRPTDEMFSGNLSLRSWITEFFPNDIVRVVDENLIPPMTGNLNAKLECVTCIMEVALKCCEELPEERCNMIDTLVSLKKIRTQYHQYLC